MKKITFAVLIIIGLASCSISKSWFKPKRFTNQFNNTDSGLESVLCLSGYYSKSIDSERGLVFFKNGLTAVIEFSENGNIDYLSWGTYVLQNDTISIQYVVNSGIDGLNVNQHFYKIQNEKRIRELGYISYHDIYIEKNHSFNFMPLEITMDTSSCWLLKKKWFWTKDAWENRTK